MVLLDPHEVCVIYTHVCPLPQAFFSTFKSISISGNEKLKKCCKWYASCCNHSTLPFT